MVWVQPMDIDSETINHAGDLLISDADSYNIDELDTAIEVLDKWRAVHTYPMHVFKIRLKRVAKQVDKNAFAVRRLKRVPAIIYKLKRKYSGRAQPIKLYELQDIAGCRAILSDVSLARKLYEKYYLKGELKHKKVKENDYVTNPKKDGYRSFHVVYSYISDKGKKEYNGLLVEIQIRSKLQHYWATAVETVDFFTRQAIKTSEGDRLWREFFRLLSSAFAKIEDCPCVKDTPTDEKELYLQIKEMEKKLNVITRMQAWSALIKPLGDIARTDPKKQFFLLDLDIGRGKLDIRGYARKDMDKALQDYADTEKRNKGKEKEFDVVLVGADTTNDLQKAYPNYFVDTKEFLNVLRIIVDKYPAQ